MKKLHLKGLDFYKESLKSNPKNLSIDENNDILNTTYKKTILDLTAYENDLPRVIKYLFKNVYTVCY